MIYVTKTYLPDRSRLDHMFDRIYESGWVTNEGPMVRSLEDGLRSRLGVAHLNFVSNGTIALQIAMKALDVKGEVITTPYSYVATTTAIMWENCKPVFVDIEPTTCCIDPSKIEEAITEKTTAILATHVYGYPCDIDAIDAIANKHGLKVIYDGAHAFGVSVKGRSLLSYGDVSTCSFHATKLFHSIEGGAVITKDQMVHDRLSLYKTFGHIDEEYISMGINAKNSEFHAAVGLCNLEIFDQVVEGRKDRWERYHELLSDHVQLPGVPEGLDYNYAYMPAFFKDEDTLLKVMDALAYIDVKPRRYFYPSLNKLPYIAGSQPCPVSEDMASRVLCLPLYHLLDLADVDRISHCINETLGS